MCCALWILASGNMMSCREIISRAQVMGGGNATREEAGFPKGDTGPAGSMSRSEWSG
jgi:hypothetical protein